MHLSEIKTFILVPGILKDLIFDTDFLRDMIAYRSAWHTSWYDHCIYPWLRGHPSRKSGILDPSPSCAQVKQYNSLTNNNRCLDIVDPPPRVGRASLIQKVSHPPLLGRNVNCLQIIVLIIERRSGVRNAWEIDTMCVPKLRVLSPAKWGVGGGGPSKSRGSGTKWKTGQRRDMKIRTKCVIDYKVTSWVCFVKTFDF